MKVFIAGATGVLGRRLVPLTLAKGHDVVGLTRTGTGRALLEQSGARAVLADALNPDEVGRAVSEAEPDVIVHQLTALPAAIDPRRLDRDFAPTNRLRTEATDHLLSAGRAVGVRRFIAQSFAGWPFARVGSAVKDEEAPLDPDPPAPMRRTLAAIRHLEEAVSGTDGIQGLVLRYGGLYGPGTSFALGPDPTATDGYGRTGSGAQVEMVRKRRFPIIGGGGGVWSFVHVDDAAAATVSAIDRGPPGIYHIVDDDPAPVSDWLPALAEAVGAPPPPRIPRWIGRLMAGEAVTRMMTEVRGASNRKACRELGWRPRYSSWRVGFQEGLD